MCEKLVFVLLYSGYILFLAIAIQNRDHLPFKTETICHDSSIQMNLLAVAICECQLSLQTSFGIILEKVNKGLLDYKQSRQARIRLTMPIENSFGLDVHYNNRRVINNAPLDDLLHNLHRGVIWINKWST